MQYVPITQQQGVLNKINISFRVRPPARCFLSSVFFCSLVSRPLKRSLSLRIRQILVQVSSPVSPPESSLFKSARGSSPLTHCWFVTPAVPRIMSKLDQYSWGSVS